MARVAVGLAIEQAKAAFTDLARGCDHVETVQPGGMRRLPTTHRNVYVQRTTSITPRTSRGTLSMETFDLPFMVEATAPWKRVKAPDDQDAADVAQLEEVSATRWTIANEIAEAIARDRRALRTVTADVIVTSEDAGFVDDLWVARAWCVVRCAGGPVV